MQGIYFSSVHSFVKNLRGSYFKLYVLLGDVIRQSPFGLSGILQMPLHSGTNTVQYAVSGWSHRAEKLTRLLEAVMMFKTLGMTGLALFALREI